MQFIVHDAPALRADSDYLAQVDLAPFGFPGLIEQVWLRQLPGGEFALCCIPFRAYGLALRDRVRLGPGGGRIAARTEPAGHRALRILFAPSRDGADGVAGLVTEAGLLSEWSGDRHLAIDVPPGTDVAALVEAAEAARGTGAYWEWSDVEPFRVA
ncbi:DUF4265 domain-containing protein [Actinoplanes regularis]|uniref:DUF4265 domain-containing protein n=1 Tax=Actinoplanes regularis TaxID=52697 RepID=A0A239F1S3_9ACTN|nr:DUF4265 domain-containing protein [Actinoplanes regularis]SNS50839.1 protein of unknown function [Actinoplanes regularis]